MKSKNIPGDIKAKTIKEAQDEIKEILEKLENTQINLEESKEQYERMIQLNHQVHRQFKQKAKEINKLMSRKSKKILSDN